MKKIIFKELREQFKVAVLGLAVLTLMVVLIFARSVAEAAQAAVYQGYSASEGLHPLLAKGGLIQVAFFCCIFGALLGWLQIRAESHPDLWAFLVHRPLPRTRILQAKIISGLLLYAAGSGLPILGLVIVSSIPGKVAAPFAWAMALPLVAIFLVGMVFYGAGLLTGLRKARWFASRGFGLGLAVVAAISVFAMSEFWQTLLFILAAGGILSLAVWGSFLTGGHYRAQPLLGKLALALASVVSVAVLIGLLAGLVANLTVEYRHFNYSYFQLLKDGRIAKITHHDMRGAQEDAEITDFNGRPLLDEQTGQPITLKKLQMQFPVALTASASFDDRPRKRNWPRQGYADAGRFFRPWLTFNKTIWHLTAEGRLMAYHGITRRLVDTLAPAGSVVSGLPDDTRFLQPDDHFPVRDYTRPEVLASAQTAYMVDLEKRELKPLFSVTNSDAIGGYAKGSFFFGLPATQLQDYVLLLTRTSIQVLDSRGDKVLHLPYQPSPPSYPNVGIYWLEPTNTFAVRFDPDYLLDRKSGGKLLTRIAWVNADGSTRNTLDLPKLPGPGSESALDLMLVALLPPAFPIYTWEEPYRAWQRLRLVPALLSALAVWWLGRRHNFSMKAKVGWGIFGFLFGLPGLLAFLAVQEWPAREACPHCQKLRVTNREQCEHCGGAFAPPPKTGVEIFEPLGGAS